MDPQRTDNAPRNFNWRRWDATNWLWTTITSLSNILASARYSGGVALLAGSNPRVGADPRAITTAADGRNGLARAEEDVGED